MTPFNRRHFMALSAGAATIGALTLSPLGRLVSAATGTPSSIKAIAFDGFAIFDPRPVFKILYDEFPDHGDALKQTWITKTFEYTWLRTLGDQYKPFTDIIRDTLHFTLQSHRLSLPADKEKAVMDSFLSLPLWPDVMPVLDEMKKQGVRMAFLSNMGEEMLRTNMKHNKIEGYFDHVLSTDRVKKFKPAPETYQMAVDAFALKKEEIAFTAFGGWDAAGAAWFGFPTIWINRQYFPPETLQDKPVVEADTLMALPFFVMQGGKLE